MSYLSDRIALLKNGLSNIDNVLESRWNKAKQGMGELPVDVEAEAQRRYEICKECPYNSVLARNSSEYYSLYGKNFQSTFEPEELRCAICLCPIEYKVLSMDTKCGLDFHNQTNPKNQQPLKWTKYQKLE